MFLVEWMRKLTESHKKIAIAECLCDGCIINKQEDISYNSVPVNVSLRVLKMILCPNNPQQYLIKAHYVTIPVACTCVVPRLWPSQVP